MKNRVTWLHSYFRSRTWQNACKKVIYVLTLCVFVLAIWTTAPISTNNEVVLTFTSNSAAVKAVYKCAYENPDGTVDLVFNIPRGGEELLRLNSLHVNMSRLTGRKPHNATNSTTTKPLPALKLKPVKSRYPVSLDSEYAINSVHVCPRGQRVDYLIIVHSATAYFSRRRAIRETYGGKNLFGHVVQRVVFLLGTTSDPTATRQIQQEALNNRDIVQGRFVDSYHNLTHKGVLGYRWVSEHCPQAKLIVKIDDDVFVNPFKLVRDVLPVYNNKTRHIACHLRRGGTSPIVRGKSKWQVHEDEFRGQNHYPFDYCNGYFVLITSDLIRPMLNAARLNPFFWIDDVYLFGILPATVGSTKFVDIRANLSLAFDAGKACLAKHGANCSLLAVSQWKADQSEALWYMVLSNLTTTAKKDLHVFSVS